MKKMLNTINLQGAVHSHNLAIRTVQNPAYANYGKEFIGGTLDVATDDEGLNVVTVYYIYVTPTTKSGSANATFTALKNIIENGKTITADGIENATKVSITTNAALNDFYTTRDGEETLVSAKRCDGGVVTIINKIDPKKDVNKFTFDMLITGARRVEANEERNLPEKLIIKGAIFNFRNAILPGIELVITDPTGMDYFESLEPSSTKPVFTKVWGEIVSQSIVESIEEEAGWGVASVRTRTHNVRDWKVTGVAREVYDFGDESVLTPEEVQKAMADRQTYLANVKARSDAYNATKAAAPTVGTTAATGSFDF